MTDQQMMTTLFGCQYTRWFSRAVCPNHGAVYDVEMFRWVCIEHIGKNNKQHIHTWARRGVGLSEYLSCTKCEEEYRAG